MLVQVSKMVHAIKMGWMKPRPARTEEDEKKKFYMLWQTDDQVEENIRRVHDPIPAPKMRYSCLLPVLWIQIH